MWLRFQVPGGPLVGKFQVSHGGKGTDEGS